jgi:hypothetical protein
MRLISRFLRAAPALLVAATMGCDDGTSPVPDSVAPAVQISSPAPDFATAGASVTVSGTATDDRGVVRVTYAVSGGAETEVAITPGTSVSFSFTAPLAAGQNALTVAAHDAAGNRSVGVLSGRRDDAPPALELTTTAQFISPALAIAGTAADEGGVARVAYRLNGGAETDVPIAPGPSAAFRADVPVPLGPVELEVRAWDALGNVTARQATASRLAAGTAQVTVVDATGAPVTDAQISAAAPASRAAAGGAAPAVVYGASGLFGVEHVGSGSYLVHLAAGLTFDLRITSPGSVPVLYRQVVVGSVTTRPLGEVRMVSAAGGATGTAEVRAVHWRFLAPLGDVTLTLRSGLNARTGPVVAQERTGADGIHTFAGIAAGHYTMELSHARFRLEPMTLVVHGGRHDVTTAGLSGDHLPTSFVLDHGPGTAALRVHLTGPAHELAGHDPSDRFHVHFDDPSYMVQSPGSLLSTTVAELFCCFEGESAITLYEWGSGVYRLSVHDWPNRAATASTALGGSGARVRVIQGPTVLATFLVPEAPGTLWTVFEIDGTLKPIDTMTYQVSGDSVP